MKEKKIKKIEYYFFNDKIDPAKSSEIFKSKSGLSKVEIFDINGNLIRENSFDKNMNEDNVIEYKFDTTNKMYEKLTFKNYHNQPLTKTYLSKYIYNNGLLGEILWYYGTFDSTGFFAKNQITYNQKKQKVRDEYTEYNDNAGKETRIYDWKDDYSYIEDRMNKEGELAERHFVKLNPQGKELEHRMNFELSSNEDFTYPVYFINNFDDYGNVLVSLKKYVGQSVQKTEYNYTYDGATWNYRFINTDGNTFSTEFRKIEYY